MGNDSRARRLIGGGELHNSDNIETVFNEDIAKEMTIEGLCLAGEIMIRTGNSIYSFSVTDPFERRGILSGGALDERAVTAALVGSVVEGEGGSCTFLSGLKTGARALFYIEIGQDVKRLLTSAITDLFYVQL
jgi:hypothetical protein